MIEPFKEAVEAAGLNFTGDIIPDGKLHRVHVEGDRPGTRNGWFVLYADEMPAGAFGCWKRDISEKWSSKDYSTMTEEEKARFTARMEAARQQQQEEAERSQADCRKWCENAWSTAKEAKDHLSLKKKGIKPYGVKQQGENLLIPLFDSAGNIHGMQFISADGSKKFKTGTAKKGNYFSIGKPKEKNLLVCEGYATAASLHGATGQTVIVAFDAGNLQPVAVNIRAKFPDTEMIICADNDQSGVGQKKAREAALAVRGLVAIPPTKGKDYNDIFLQKGAEAVQQSIREAINPEQTNANKEQSFPFASLAEMVKQPRPKKWLIKPLLEAGTMLVIYGESGQLKSFVILGMALSLVTWRPWLGKYPVKKTGPVFIICGEGYRGISARLKADVLDRQIDNVEELPLFVSQNPVQVLDDSSIDSMVQTIDAMTKEHGQPVLIVLDTLARCFGPGDENATVDMSKYVAALDKVKARYGCAIVNVHHSGLSDNNRSRGSSALKAAADFEYRIEGVEDDVRKITATKVKDGEEPDDIYVKPKPVLLGWLDEDGEDMSSIVLEETCSSQDTSPEERLTGAKKVVYEALKRLCKDAAEVERANSETDRGNLEGLVDAFAPVHEDEWREESYKSGVSNSDKQEAKRQAFSRAKNSLLEQELIIYNDDFYRPNL